MTAGASETGNASDQAAASAAPAQENAANVSQRFHIWLQTRWFWILFRLQRPTSYPQVVLLFVYAYVLAFVAKWAAVWAVLAILAPDWLLPSDAAMTTIAQVLPALMVSVFVFILGSFFVVTQLATSIHSNRASLLLLRDSRVQQAVARPLVISLFTLVLVLLSPQNTDQVVAALALVLVVATAFTLLNAATLLPYLITAVTAPRNFALYVLEDVETILLAGSTGDVVYRVGALGEMLKRGVKSGDMLQLKQAVGGLEGFHAIYLEAVKQNPDARVHRYDEAEVEGWLGEEMAGVLVSAAQEALNQDIDNQESNRMAHSLAGFGMRSAQAGHAEEFNHAADGLASMAVCTQQMKAPGLVNAYTEPVYGLACLVRDGTEHLGRAEGARALALWGLAIAYAIQHLGANIDGIPGHTHWEKSLRAFPDDSPWEEAHDYIQTEEFQGPWANQLGAIRAVFGPVDESPQEEDLELPEDEEVDGVTGAEDGPQVMFPGGALAVHQWLLIAKQQHSELHDGELAA